MKQLQASLFALITVIAPLKPGLLAVMVLTLVDLILGVWAAYKRKERITSSGLKRTVVKTLVYQSTVILGFFAERYLIGDTLPVVKIITGYIGITELKSVLENIEEISGMKLLSSLINRLSAPKE